MQHRSRQFVSTLVAVTMAMAAPTASPSVFAGTAEAAGSTPTPTPTPGLTPTPTPTPALTPTPTALPSLKAAPAAPSNPIRIGLGRSQSTVELTAPGGLAVVVAGLIQWQSAPNQVVKLTISGTQIQLAGMPNPLAGPVRVVPLAPPREGAPSPFPDPLPRPVPGTAPANPISYNRKPYRGEFAVLVSARDNRLSVVNVVNQDDYLMGVVPKEMPTGWPAEALKAQAVAARTYAMRNKGKYSDEGFDLVDTTMDQAYGGSVVEKPSTTAAVLATSGEVITYSGQLAGPVYHSSSGGHTENNEIIFQSAPIPYLRGVVDFDNMPGNTRYAWTYTYTPEEFAQKLAGANHNIGPVVGAEAAGAVGSSGRPSRWSLKGMFGSTELTAQQFRTALELPSSVRAILVKPAQPGGPGQPGGPDQPGEPGEPGEPVQPGNGKYFYQGSDQVYVVDADGVPRARVVRDSAVVSGAGGLPHLIAGTMTAQGAGGQPAGTTQTAASTRASAPTPTPVAGGVEVVGGGYGHAVGMSQWGAYGMALQGKSYMEILTHFYQGTKVERR